MKNKSKRVLVKEARKSIKKELENSLAIQVKTVVGQFEQYKTSDKLIKKAVEKLARAISKEIKPAVTLVAETGHAQSETQPDNEQPATSGKSKKRK